MRDTEMAVAVVLFRDNGGVQEVLMVRERVSDAKYRKKAGQLSVPAGHVQRGETMLEAALRELKEEAGYSALLREEDEVWRGDIGPAHVVAYLGTSPLQVREQSELTWLWIPVPWLLELGEREVRPHTKEIVRSALKQRAFAPDAVH